MISTVIPVVRSKIANINLPNPSSSQRNPRFTSNADDTFFSELAITKVSDFNMRNVEALNKFKNELLALEQSSFQYFGDYNGGPQTLLTILSRKRAMDKAQYEETIRKSSPLMKLWHRLKHKPKDYMTWGEFKSYFDERRQKHYHNMLDSLIRLGLLVDIPRNDKYESVLDRIGLDYIMRRTDTANDKYKLQITELGEECVRSGGFKSEI